MASSQVNLDLLFLAAENGRLKEVKRIVQNSEDKNPRDKNGWTPLHFASRYGHLNIVKFLVPFLSDKNPKSGAQFEESTPLHEAAFHGKLHIVEYLCQQIEGDINPSNSHGGTVLHWAAQYGHLDVVCFYTNTLTNPNPESLTNNQFRGRTPLHCAALKGHLPVVKHICRLLQDKNPKDSNGQTPLHLAAYWGHLEVVKYLVRHVEDIHPKDGLYYGQKTPLDYAKQKNRAEVVNFFEHLDAIAKLKQRKAAKGDKNVKTSIVTKGNDEEYDIDNVLQSLGIDTENKKDTSKKKPRTKTKKTKKPQDQKAPEPEPQPSGAEAVVREPLQDECTICYEPRIQTYVFIPCGHATFCKDCALHIFENTDKRCPDCRSRIQQTFRIFQ